MHLQFLQSPVPHGKIKSMDLSAALKMPGVSDSLHKMLNKIHIQVLGWVDINDMPDKSKNMQVLNPFGTPDDIAIFPNNGEVCFAYNFI